jgi:hypothetical protein
MTAFMIFPAMALAAVITAHVLDFVDWIKQGK